MRFALASKLVRVAGPTVTGPTVTLVCCTVNTQAFALLSASVLAKMQSAYMAWIAALAQLHHAYSGSSKICSTCV